MHSANGKLNVMPITQPNPVRHFDSVIDKILSCNVHFIMASQGKINGAVLKFFRPIAT